MGQDPNQPYPGQYGQPGEQGGYQPQGGYQQQQEQTGAHYQQPYGQQPYGQQPGGGYQQPYGQPGFQQIYHTGHPLGQSSMGLAPNVSAALSYVFGWLSGLIVFFVEKRNRFVRFHAMQSILLSVTLIIVGALLRVFFTLPIIGLLGGIIEPVFGIASFALWIFLIINAYRGKYYKLPIIGDYAERYANQGTPLM